MYILMPCRSAKLAAHALVVKPSGSSTFRDELGSALSAVLGCLMDQHMHMAHQHALLVMSAMLKIS